MPKRTGAKNKDSEARLGLNPTLHEELVGAHNRKPVEEAWTVVEFKYSLES